jgi:hypothetical protein
VTTTVYLETHELGRKRGEAIKFSLRISTMRSRNQASHLIKQSRQAAQEAKPRSGLSTIFQALSLALANPPSRDAAIFKRPAEALG